MSEKTTIVPGEVSNAGVIGSAVVVGRLLGNPSGHIGPFLRSLSGIGHSPMPLIETGCTPRGPEMPFPRTAESADENYRDAPAMPMLGA